MVHPLGEGDERFLYDVICCRISAIPDPLTDPIKVFLGSEVEPCLLPLCRLFLYACGRSTVDAYWCLHTFLQLHHSLYTSLVTSVFHHVNNLSRLLAPRAPELWRHLHDVGLVMDLFGDVWFGDFFITALPIPSAISVFDALIAISPDLLSCIGVSLLVRYAPRLLDLASTDQIKAFLMKLPPNTNIRNVIKHAIKVFNEVMHTTW